MPPKKKAASAAATTIRPTRGKKTDDAEPGNLNAVMIWLLLTIISLS
jgi:hypothetical protein